MPVTGSPAHGTWVQFPLKKFNGWVAIRNKEEMMTFWERSRSGSAYYLKIGLGLYCLEEILSESYWDNE